MSNSAESSSPRRGARHRLHAGATIVLLALVPLAGKSLNVTDGLNVTPSLASGNSVPYGGGAAGISNSVTGSYAFAVGNANQVAGYEGNFAAGKDNFLNSTSSGIIGEHNTISATGLNYSNFIWGKNNQIGGVVDQSMAGGMGNVVDGHFSIAEGYSNTVSKGYASARGYTNRINSHAGHAIGTLLINNSSYATVVGISNAVYGAEGEAAAKDTWRSQDPIFVIGNGNNVPGDPQERSNALVVTKGGTAIFSQSVILEGAAVSGEIPMYNGNN